jgi:para-nitrobenzyl esterase
VSDDTSLAHAIFRDAWMGAPARWFAARHAASSPAFLYQFAYVPDALKDRRRAANHGFEMLFVFKALARAPIPLPASTADAREMNVVHDCWVGFVDAGSPGCPDSMPWPPYKPATDTLLLFGQDGARPVAAFRKPVYDLLDAIEARALAGAGAGR